MWLLSGKWLQQRWLSDKVFYKRLVVAFACLWQYILHKGCAREAAFHGPSCSRTVFKGQTQIYSRALMKRSLSFKYLASKNSFLFKNTIGVIETAAWEQDGGAGLPRLASLHPLAPCPAGLGSSRQEKWWREVIGLKYLHKKGRIFSWCIVFQKL